MIFIERTQIKHAHVDTFFNFYLFIYSPRSSLSFCVEYFWSLHLVLCRIYWLARQIDFALFVCINAAANLLKSIINNSTHTHVQRKRDRAMPNAPFYCSTRVVKNKYVRCKKCRKNTVNQRNERATYTHSHTHNASQQKHTKNGDNITTTKQSGASDTAYTLCIFSYVLFGCFAVYCVECEIVWRRKKHCAAFDWHVGGEVLYTRLSINQTVLKAAT